MGVSKLRLPLRIDRVNSLQELGASRSAAPSCSRTLRGERRSDLNQDELLERLWVEVINAVDGVALAQVPRAEPKDAQHVARLARYEALFGWCDAFDEAGRTVAWWLRKPEEDPAWLELSKWSAEAATSRRKPRPGTPFADAEESRIRLLEAGLSDEVLAEWMTAQGRLALAQLRAILESGKWKARELAGLHEALLSADPSGLEGRPGSWPVPSPQVEPARQGLRLKLGKAHALAFSPDGARVVAAKGGAITELTSGRGLAKCKLLAHTSHITWSPDGKWIAATSTSGDIAVCAADTGARATVLSQKSEGVAPVFANDRELVGATWGGAVVKWDVEQGQLLAGVRLNVSMVLALQLAGDGQVVLLVRLESEAMACVRFSPDLKECLGTLPVPSWASDLALATAGGRALLTGQTYAAWLDLTTGELSEPFDSTDPLVGGAVSPDGKSFVLTSLKGFLIGSAEDLANGRQHPLLYANEATFSADSRQLALATWEAGEIWDVEALVGGDNPLKRIKTSAPPRINP